ncbi:MAG: hypothetical protein DRP01_01680 [Archaeoglobales archaeon]|nr:MAG: hypothetical protein DRP01_01680 [Archaeoglobales archaeon]
MSCPNCKEPLAQTQNFLICPKCHQKYLLIPFDKQPPNIPHSKDEFIRFLQNQVAQYMKIIDKQRQRIQLLEDTLREKIDTSMIDYQELSKHLKGIEKLVYKTIITLCKRWGHPISYEQIVKGFRTMYPVEAKTETITRAVRKLKEQGLIFSPKRGLFFPTSLKPQQPTLLSSMDKSFKRASK